MLRWQENQRRHAELLSDYDAYLKDRSRRHREAMDEAYHLVADQEELEARERDRIVR